MTISNLNTDKIKSSEIASKINELVSEVNTSNLSLSQDISDLKQNQVMWSSQGEIGSALLVDDQVFFSAQIAGQYYGLYHSDLNGNIKKTIHNTNNWIDSFSTQNGNGFRASLCADYLNGGTYARIFAQYENRVETFIYDRINKACGSASHYAAYSTGSNFFGRNWYIVGVSDSILGKNRSIYCAVSYPHSTWNNFNHYTITRMNHTSSNNNHNLYNGDYRYLGNDTDESTRSDDGTRIYVGGNARSHYPSHAGTGQKGNRALYMFNPRNGLMHRFIVPGSGVTADDLWNISYTNSSTNQAQLTHDKTFHIPALITSSSNNYITPQVQFDEYGNEVAISAGTVVDDASFRQSSVRIIKWNPNWGTGKP